MRTRWLLCGVLGLLTMVPTARAGLYIPAESTVWPLPTKTGEYLFQLRELLSLVSVEKRVQEREFPKRVLEQIKKLEARRSDGKLSVEDSINLGGYYILQKKYNNAIDVLTPAWEREPKNFMVLANLANAYEGSKEYRRAAAFQDQVLKNWPRRQQGWNAEQLWWYRRAEKYFLTLLELRNREQLTKQPESTLDALFPRLPFADPRVPYLVGEIDIKARDRLPPDVLPLVEQLLLWLPHDNRLYWMLGELLNARGDVVQALGVFNDLVGIARRFNSDLLMRHRRLLNEAVESDPRFKRSKTEVMPERQVLASSPPTEKPGGPGQTGWLPDWRQLGVGFGSGLLVGILLLLQVRQLRRRFSGSQARPSPG
jgi:tetratricopeptide (TPR) repeat protein